MADIYNNKEVVSLLKNKQLLFMGGSNMRAQYKDLVWLLNTNTVIRHDFLKRKLEKSFLGDRLVKRSELHRGRDFEEVRSYNMAVKLGIKIDYMFITKCFNKDIQQLFSDFKNKKKPAPSIIIMNSCLWDLTRWGPDGANLYKQNMKKLMKLFEECLPVTTLVIWSTALPVAGQIRGGLLIKQIEFLKHTLRFDVMEANHFARSIVSSHGYDVLDIHHYMRYQVHRRGRDGVHYQPVAVRYMTNLMLTHIALSWDHPLPGRVINSIVLEKMCNSDCVGPSPDTNIKLHCLENIAQCTNAGMKNTDAANKQSKSVVHKALENAVLTKTIGPDRPNKRLRSNRNKPYNTGQRYQ